MIRFKDEKYEFGFEIKGYKLSVISLDAFESNLLNTTFYYKINNKVFEETRYEFTADEIGELLINIKKILDSNVNQYIFQISNELNCNIDIYFYEGMYNVNINYDSINNDEIKTSSLYTKEEMIQLYNELKQEYSKAPYRSISQLRKGINFDQIKEFILYNYPNINYTIYPNRFVIKFHDLFSFMINDVMFYFNKDNSKHYFIDINDYVYDFIKENMILKFIKEVIEGKQIFVQYKKQVGLFNKKLFKTINDENKLSKYLYNNKVLLIASSKRIYYFDIVIAATDETLFKKNKFININKDIYKLYLNEYKKERIQIMKEEDLFYYIVEKFDIYFGNDKGCISRTGDWGKYIEKSKLYNSYEDITKDLDLINKGYNEVYYK